VRRVCRLDGSRETNEAEADEDQHVYTTTAALPLCVPAAAGALVLLKMVLSCGQVWVSEKVSRCWHVSRARSRDTYRDA